jgi:hypothetical protein
MNIGGMVLPALMNVCGTTPVFSRVGGKESKRSMGKL